MTEKICPFNVLNGVSGTICHSGNPEDPHKNNVPEMKCRAWVGSNVRYGSKPISDSGYCKLVRVKSK